MPAIEVVEKPFRVVADGLRFPEGPVALADGSLLVVEIERRSLTRIAADGKVEPVAILGGSPNGAAIGPDGRCYVCNSGGMKFASDPKLGLWPVARADDYENGSIDVVDLKTGRWERLYERHEHGPLLAPNDLVFDAHGGFWFSEVGHRSARDAKHGGVYYARADGSEIREVIYPLTGPNGVALSPDGRTLYVAETVTGRVWAFEVTAPGEIRRLFPVGGWPDPSQGHVTLAGASHAKLLFAWPDIQLFDSMAVDGEGWVCVGTLVKGGITCVSPDGSRVQKIPLPDPKSTNICFGGPDLRTAFVTFSGHGKLVALDWDRPGLRLNYQ
jgi:gluconolactonase